MKYIITENQKEKIVNTILNYFDNNLTPSDGWKPSINHYKIIADLNGEIFFFLTDMPGGNGPNMWYSKCDNHNLQGLLDKEICPLLLIPTSIYESLDGFFGDLWKPLFLKWFKSHTHLPIKKVDSHYD